MRDQLLDRERVRSARDALIASGLHTGRKPLALLRAEIDRSWRRSIGVGASVSGAMRYINEFDRDSELYRAAQPVLDRLHDTLHDMGVAVFLSDARGQIVARRASSGCDVARLDSSCAAEGFDFSEQCIGTNGLGTAMNENAAVFICGPEHFNDALEGLACAGMGIRHPATGRVVGSLSLASTVESAELLMVAMTREATQQIVRNLGDASGRRDLALTAAYQRHRRRGPVIVLNRDTVMTNVAGLPFISPDGHARLWETLLGLDWHAGPQMVELDVATLDGPVLAHRIEDVADDPAFAVEVLQARREQTPRGRATTAPSLRPSRGGQVDAGGTERWTPAQAAVRDQLDEGFFSTRGMLLITGPSGAGKVHTVTSWLLDHAMSTPAVFDIADLGESVRWGQLVHRALDEGRSVVLRRAEDLQPQQHNRLKDLAARLQDRDGSLPAADRAAARSQVFVTADRTHCASEVLDLLMRLATEFALPGLASSRESIPQLITMLCEPMAPSSRPALSAPAMQALMRWYWPGNIAELKATLEGLASSRPGQVVLPEHLPEHLRLAQRRRRLTRIEAAERSEIVAALNQAGGNRSRAAELLGIGRTTLYRKLQTLGIEATDALAV